MLGKQVEKTEVAEQQVVALLGVIRDIKEGKLPLERVTIDGATPGQLTLHIAPEAAEQISAQSNGSGDDSSE